jgi:hypothetical protein
MKMFVALAVVLWLLCGVAGAWMLEGAEMHAKTIALGPIAVMRGFNQAPEWIPGPN